MRAEVCVRLAFCFQCQTLTRGEQLLSPVAATPAGDLIWAGSRLAAGEGTRHHVPLLGGDSTQISFIHVDYPLFYPYARIHTFGCENSDSVRGSASSIIFVVFWYFFAIWV